jgi:Holliday junction DNA helicase RuvA
MIGFLRGKVVKKEPPFLWMDVQGVGYEVEAPMSSFYQISDNPDSEVLLLIHMHVREDAMQLFGFASEAEKLLFKTLIKVNGVGAKMALSILSAMSVSEFCQSVDQANITALTRIPGVGKKTAERLQIEMRDRLKPLMDSGILGYDQGFSLSLQSSGERGAVSTPQIGLQAKAIEALVALGYKDAQAQKMVKSVEVADVTLEELIREALKGVAFK